MQSSLARTVPKPPTPPHEMQRLRERAWRETKVAVIPIDQLRDDWERQIVTNIANRLYGMVP
jgi:hypothetical protein